MNEELKLEDLAKAIAEETGVSVEVAKAVLTSFGEYLALHVNQDGEFDIPASEFEDIGDGC